MASTTVDFGSSRLCFESLNWRESIGAQLQLRKSREQTPFEEICMFVNNMFDKVDIYKTENIKLTLQKEQLQQQLSNIQQTLLAGGSDAAKTIISNVGVSDDKIALKELENKYRTLKDEHLALTLSYKSLEKKHNELKKECDAMSMKILAAKREDAERLNAENERIIKLQRERAMREIEAKVATIDKDLLARQAAGDPSALALTADNFETIDESDLKLLNLTSRIPEVVQMSFDAHVEGLTAVKWYSSHSPQDSYIATGGQDRRVKIWKIDESESLPVSTALQGSNSSITSIDVDGDAILASSNDFATRVWSLSTHRLNLTLTGHSAKVNSAKFLGTPTKIASGSADRTIKLWDVNRGACVKTFWAGSNLTSLVYGSYVIISGHFDRKIRCWDLSRADDNDPTWVVQLECKITAVDISNDMTKVVCCLKDNTIKCVDLRTLEVLQTYSDEKLKTGEEYWRVCFSPDDRFISCGSNDGSFFIWDATTAKVEKILKGHNNKVIATTWSPDGKRMASIEHGRKVNIWA